MRESAGSIVPKAHGGSGVKLVVVIDDDPLVLDGMRGLLRSWGHRVVAARSAVAALAELSGLGRKPDLIISDYRLSPATTGVEAIARLRHAYPVPAFLISGEIAAESLKDVNASGYPLLHKPVHPAALRAMIDRLLEN
jgi:CheY-like chemotaxis protein